MTTVEKEFAAWLNGGVNRKPRKPKKAKTNYCSTWAKWEYWFDENFKKFASERYSHKKTHQLFTKEFKIDFIHDVKIRSLSK